MLVASFTTKVVILPAAAALIVLAGLVLYGTVEAGSHSAVRSFSAPSVEPGGQVEVTVTAANVGAAGQVVETLPAGFIYGGSDLPDSAVELEGRTARFSLFTVDSVTYTLTAPSEEGQYTFSGVVRDQAKEETPIGGASTLPVGPPPTPTPTPTSVPTASPQPTATPVMPTATATPRPTATATPIPTATATPRPTATATPVPTATPAPQPTAPATPVPTATPAPQPTATATPVPRPTATATPAPQPTVAPPASLEEPDEGGVPAWVWALIGLAAFGLLAAGAYHLLRRRPTVRRYR